jgi:hypothetical protein
MASRVKVRLGLIGVRSAGAAASAQAIQVFMLIEYAALRRV